jgi:hypothetical protein
LKKLTAGKRVSSFFFMVTEIEKKRVKTRSTEEEKREQVAEIESVEEK